MGESAFNLIAKLSSRPVIKGLHLFETNSLRPGEIIEITGNPGSGKTLFLSHLLLKTISAKELGGAGANAVLIDCEHHFNILYLSSTIECLANTMMQEEVNYDEREKKIKEVVKLTLSRLHIFRCFNFDNIMLSFHNLKRFLLKNTDVSLIAFDNVASFYWKQRAFNHDFKKFNTHVEQIVASFYRCLGDFQISFIYTRPSYFKTRRSQTNLSSNLGSGKVNTSVYLKMNRQRSRYSAEIRCNDLLRVMYFEVNDCGVSWLDEASERVR